ncbi:sigma-70 family RNA polymerase sigma factor [Chryseobacterium sp. PBS4-4]|uniref:Sigma-70 family RNA polymerase sigma factor n=1 Tax=Chryseobacterium edaphi TaxID=2976532 RepID=A0ABT2W2H6_9FLAO|nr:sigma-70 family RNA polymerase sigma factor [Chryseobacterium edaphi]MCU7616139.1 sigma-70 family RNA polymerase sigma factor [Chryseobacterium edaphi]
MTFDQIYHSNKNLVYNLALHYVQNVKDAEEITQDVFLSVHEKLDTFQNKSKISTWIYKITIHKSLDFIKAKKAKKRFGFISSLWDEKPDLSKRELVNFDHPGVMLENKEAMKKLFDIINTLNEKQKTVIILNKIEQKTISETAEIMNLSVKAIESLLQRAKNNIKTKGNY